VTEERCKGCNNSVCWLPYTIQIDLARLGIGTKVLIGHPSTWEQLNTHFVQGCSVCARGGKRERGTRTSE